MGKTQAFTTANKEQEEIMSYAGYHSIITGVNRSWEYGGFPLPDGTFWRYREPNAVIVVEGERMRATAKLSRANDQVQILDNAKNMFFSTRRFEIPEKGQISFEWDMKALCSGMPFPGVPEPADTENAVKPKYFCDFNELSLSTTPGHQHRYRISYHRGKDEVHFFVDREEVGIYTEVPVKINGLKIALGLMTEKPIEQGKSVSVHGQVLSGIWSTFTITTNPE